MKTDIFFQFRELENHLSLSVVLLSSRIFSVLPNNRNVLLEFYEETKSRCCDVSVVQRSPSRRKDLLRWLPGSVNHTESLTHFLLRKTDGPRLLQRLLIIIIQLMTVIPVVCWRKRTNKLTKFLILLQLLMECTPQCMIGRDS